MSNELLTQREIETIKRHSTICKQFRDYKSRFPEASKTRIANCIATNVSVTAMTVINVLRKHNLWD